MALSINTRLVPYRLVLSRKEPLQLDVEITNEDAESKMLTVRLELPRSLSTEKGGYANERVEYIPELEAGGARKFYFDIHGKQMTRTGEETALLKVLEHHQNRNYVIREYKKEIPVIVE